MIFPSESILTTQIIAEIAMIAIMAGFAFAVGIVGVVGSFKNINIISFM